MYGITWGVAMRSRKMCKNELTEQDKVGTYAFSNPRA